MRFPWQLEDCELILLRYGSKRPVHKWQDHTGGKRFRATSETKKLIETGQFNYAVYCGNGLIVIDADEPVLRKAIEKDLPETFTVKTGSGGRHYYFHSDLERKVILYNRDGNHIGEIQAGGQAYVVGPPSKHPNGNFYEVINDIEIADLSKEEIEAWIQSNGFRDKKRQTKREIERNFSNTLDIPVTDFLYPDNARYRGSEVYGSHPIHGSTTGMNFWVNTVKNTWYCFRCESGGGPIEAFAVAERIIDCSEAGPSCFTKEQFKEILSMLKERGYDIPEFSSFEDKAKREFNYLVKKLNFELSKRRKRKGRFWSDK